MGKIQLGYNVSMQYSHLCPFVIGGFLFHTLVGGFEILEIVTGLANKLDMGGLSLHSRSRLKTKVRI